MHVTADPARTHILVAADGDRILGTMGVTVSYDRDDLELATGVALHDRHLDFPAGTVIRLATSELARGHNLNHVFRQHMLWAAMESGIRCFCSSQAAGTPNIAAMQALGYRYEEVASSMQTTVAVADGALMLNWLNAEQFPDVLERLRWYLHERAAPSVPWEGQPLRLV